MKKVLVAVLALFSLAQAQQIRADGSSTVYPITQSVAEEFNIVRPDVKVTVAFSGTGGGFKKFCVGETDLQNASRPITKAEIEECRKNGIEYIELPVAFDGLTVVVNPQKHLGTVLNRSRAEKNLGARFQSVLLESGTPQFPCAPACSVRCGHRLRYL
ncbi:MAG: hypothetical protein KatS3mg073_1523 [Meiothermus sp.]|nr:MAG: hypothetical protein KatS3mg073_1523 [Meiothermus sp.]